MFTAVWVDWRRHLAIAGVALVALGGLGIGAYFLVDSLRGDGDQASSAPAPRVVVHEQQPQTVEDLGFPAFATKNTTRVAGSDPVADAAGVALAVFPSTGGVEGPGGGDARERRRLGLGDRRGEPDGPTRRRADPDHELRRNAGPHRQCPGRAQPARLGRHGRSSGVRGGVRGRALGTSARCVSAAGIRRSSQPPSNGCESTLGADPPQHVLLVSSEKPEFSMPAAAWSARSGDPVLFVGRDAVPKPTLDALRRLKGVPVYALGPPSAISDQALAQVDKVTATVKRIGADDPVQNAIDFARYVDGTFGWNVSDPGHGFVIANESRPLDAAAAAALSASGDWGPLLLTDDPTQVPGVLRSYLLDVKPGYVSDPTRAVYNHVWLIGDQDAISVGFQAQVDELAEVAQVRSGSGPKPSAPSGRPEHEPSGPSKP